MLSTEDNEILTRVGKGTPMGDLLRRYWIPACLMSEVAEPDGPPARVRLLGEDLVAFRDTSGQVGLIEESGEHHHRADPVQHPADLRGARGRHHDSPV
jgi:hypothetical protein